MSALVSLFSTDIQPTLTPWAATPAPATLVRWDNDLDLHAYSPPALVRRGAVIRTGGGTVVHDMGTVISDARITASGNVESGTWMSTPTVQALQSAYNAGGEYYFCDGFRIWRVRFLPGPEAALEVALNLNWKMAKDEEVWSWALKFLVLSEEQI